MFTALCKSPKTAGSSDQTKMAHCHWIREEELIFPSSYWQRVVQQLYALHNRDQGYSRGFETSPYLKWVGCLFVFSQAQGSAEQNKSLLMCLFFDHSCSHLLFCFSQGSPECGSDFVYELRMGSFKCYMCPLSKGPRRPFNNSELIQGTECFSLSPREH